MSASAATIGPVQALPQDRALLWGLLASIALHALVLLGLSHRDAPAPPAKKPLVLTARLAPVAAPREPPQSRSQPQPDQQIVPPPPPKSVPVPRRGPSKPVATSAPTPQETAPAEAVKTAPPESAPVTDSPVTSAPVPVSSSAQPTGTSQARSAPQAPAAVTAGATAKSGGEADKGTLEQYRLSLIAATRRYKRYPVIAMERGWQGRVEVRMVIGANGMLASASIKTSSGHEILDKQAVDMLRKGKTTVPIPAGLRGREFAVDVPVIFNLESSRS